MSERNLEPIDEPFDDPVRMENSVMEYIPQWQEKLGWKLYPQSHFDMPEMNGAYDCLRCETVVHLSFLDRIRLLISGTLLVTTKTVAENRLGKHKTASGANVQPPSWLSRK